MNTLVKGAIFRHYKGSFYEIVALATHTETMQEFVVYKPLHGAKVWARPADAFLELARVESGDGLQMMAPRFQLATIPLK